VSWPCTGCNDYTVSISNRYRGHVWSATRHWSAGRNAGEKSFLGLVAVIFRVLHCIECVMHVLTILHGVIHSTQMIQSDPLLVLVAALGHFSRSLHDSY
jgi:hypothetical protein